VNAFQDHFSRGADRYARFRPRYPSELYDHLARSAPDCRRAWDCGTGSGQAAVGLAGFFDRVIATDASVAQVAHRERHPHVDYAIGLAESAPLAEASVDVVTAAQALHWFDLDGFYREARRVLVPDGVVAVWCYTLPTIVPPVDDIVRRFHRDVVGPYWPDARQRVEKRYATISFPFDELEATRFSATADWTLEQLLGYLGTWSASARYRRARGTEPVAEIAPAVEGAWGDPSSRRRVVWPLHLRAGRVL
jgi:SAM-dependent methyltransferase